MRKYTFRLMLTMLLLTLAVGCRAEEAGLTDSSFTVSVSGCVLALILLAFLVLLSRAWGRIAPVLDSWGLQIDAEVAARAVEAVIGRGQGSTKWKMALERLSERGWNTESENVRAALKAAWQILNMGMMTSGEKIPGEQMPENA